MKLLIDIGNTRLKWAWLRDGALGATQAAVHDGAPARCISELPHEPVDDVWISSVMGSAHEAAIGDAVRTRFGLAPQFARTRAEWRGLRNAYREPERLGVDRWLTMIAAWHRQRGAAAIASAGTALTVDLVSADGQHRGGIIAAGLGSQLRTMLATTRFPTRNLDGTPFRDVLGDDTESCVRQGALFACIGAIEQVARHADPGALCLLTGGDAPALQIALDTKWEHRPQLVLEGLQALASDAL